MNNATVAAGKTLTIDGHAIDGGNLFDFDGSAETNGHYVIIAGLNFFDLIGGAQSDTSDLTHSDGVDGGNAQGGGGNDTFLMGGSLIAGNAIDGGAGTDTVDLDGDYSGGLVFGPTTMTNVEWLNVAAGHSYNLTTDNATVASGATLVVDAHALGVGDTLTFDGSAEADGSFNFVGGAGNDVVTGGAQADTLTGGGGADTFTCTAVGQSTGPITTHDITDFDASVDSISAGLRKGQRPPCEEVR